MEKKAIYAGSIVVAISIGNSTPNGCLRSYDPYNSGSGIFWGYYGRGDIAPDPYCPYIRRCNFANEKLCWDPQI
ncbi:hypothetical protein JXI42_00600 [bacterium]|nr:hypothetical protein [bacterium]